MSTQTLSGQYRARTLWETHASGAAFDRKKTPSLTERAHAFIAQQAMCVIAGLSPHNELDGVLVMGQPGFVQVLDESTCLLRLEMRSRASRIVRRMHQALLTEQTPWLSLFFICHATRERLCVQATVEMLAPGSSAPFCSSYSASSIVVRLHIREAFFHCSKYIRTRIAGLTVPGTADSLEIGCLQDLLNWNQTILSEEHRRFLSQQVLCFLCTVNQEGRCAVNHRGGTRGFLAAFPPYKGAPGGIILLPDFAGNGAFEAVGNILETEQAALVVPNYAAQVALCISGKACVVNPEVLHVELAQCFAGSERVVALAVRHVEVQAGNWSSTLAYECARAESLWAHAHAELACSMR